MEIELAALITGGGIRSTAVERHIPCLRNSDRRGDLMTQVGGLIPIFDRSQLARGSRLIMDVRIGHTFTTAHLIKKHSIRDMESAKRAKYRCQYQAQGYAFAPIVFNSWGETGPDALRLLWAVADHAARYHLAMPEADCHVLPHSSLSSAQDAQVAEEQEETFKSLRGRLNNEYRQRMLVALYEGITERVHGRTYALSALQCYRDSMAAARAVWQPVFHPVSARASSASLASEAADSPVLSGAVSVSVSV